MAKGNKITGQDIFDENVAVAYKKFTELNKEATQQLEKLRRKIVSLNKVLKKNMDADGPMRDLEAATKDYANAADKAEKESKQLGKAVDEVGKKAKKTKASTRGMTSGFKKLSGGIKSLLGAAGLVGIAYALVDVTKKTYQTSKAIESMDLALSKVTKSSYEFDQAQRFLVTMSERLGLNILKTAKRYNTFTAAAQQANLTQSESNDIFETFADVGANLALTSDEMGSIFLALEQMLSKGKVSTEELRRQLGEKLPGAMGIMADALGVSTGKLDDMLRKGEVLSEDALPKFAKQVEETFGVDKTKRIETLASAQERLTNAWVLLIDKINEDGGGVNVFFKGVFGLLEDGLAATIDAVEDAGILMKADLSGWERFWVLSKGILGFEDDLEEIYAEGRAQMAVNNRLKTYQELVNAAKNYYTIAGKADEFDSSMFASLVEDGEIAEEMIPAITIMIEDYKKKIEAIKIANKNKGSLKDTVKNIFVPDTAEVKEELEKSFTVVENLIKDRIERMKADLFVDSGLPGGGMFGHLMKADNYDWLKKEIDEAEKKLTALRKGYLSPEADDLAFYEQGRQRRETPMESGEDEFKGTILGGFGDLEAWGERLTAAQEIYGAIMSIEEEAHQARLDRIEEEEDRIRSKYEKLLVYAEGDSEEQSRIRMRQADEQEALDEERRKVEREAAIQRKEQARVDAILSAAVGSIKVWATSGNPYIAIAMQAVIAATLLSSLAAINKTHIPEYAEGTDNHPGGLAVVGDGGKKEMIVTPSGKAYLTDNKPQVVSMQKGSKVISDANDYIQKEVIKSIVDSDQKINELMVDKISEAIQRGFTGARISNKLTVNNKFDFQSFRDRVIRGYS